MKSYSVKQIKPVFINETAVKYGEPMKIENKHDAVKFWEKIVSKQEDFDTEKEMLVVVALNTKLAVKGWNIVSVGTLNETLARPREIFRPLVAISAYGFVLMHNHPSGNSEPSRDDHKLTTKINEAARIMDIIFFDHVVVANSSQDGPFDPIESFSFREGGCL